MSSPIAAAIDTALAAIAKRELTNVFFVACGGSFAQMHLPKYAIDRQAKTLVADAYNSAEFLARDMPRLGASSVVVCCSSSGNTPETVEAAKFARARGAYTIGITQKADSPLAAAVDCCVGYDNTQTTSSIDAGGGVLLRIAFGLLAQREGNTGGKAVIDAMAKLPELVKKAQDQHAEEVLRWAAASKRESVIYTMASGPNHGVAYAFAICILQEMQWIHSQGIHAGEYFHGPFEITDFDTPIIMLLGTGPSRKMDERALAFAQKFSKRVLVLDIEKIDAMGIAPGVMEYLQSMIFTPMLRNYAIRLADDRGHPLTVRRYMWRMDY